MADKNQSSSRPQERLEFCPQAALCPTPHHGAPLPGPTDQFSGWLPTCWPVVSTPVALAFCGVNGKKRTAGPEGEQATVGLPHGWLLTQILPRPCPGRPASHWVQLHLLDAFHAFSPPHICPPRCASLSPFPRWVNQDTERGSKLPTRSLSWNVEELRFHL